MQYSVAVTVFSLHISKLHGYCRGEKYNLVMVITLAKLSWCICNSLFILVVSMWTMFGVTNQIMFSEYKNTQELVLHSISWRFEFHHWVVWISLSHTHTPYILVIQVKRVRVVSQASMDLGVSLGQRDRRGTKEFRGCRAPRGTWETLDLWDPRVSKDWGACPLRIVLWSRGTSVHGRTWTVEQTTGRSQ